MRILLVEIQGIQIVILAGDVEDADPPLRFAAQKPGAYERVVLPEIISRQAGHVALIVLVIPQRFTFEENTGRVIVYHKQLRLLQSGFCGLARVEIGEMDGPRHIDKTVIQRRLADFVL